MTKPRIPFARRSRALAAIGVIAALGAGGSLAAGVAGSPTPARAEVTGESPIPGATCSGHRWAAKTLTDPGAGSVNTSPRDTTINAMQGLSAHPTAGGRVAPFETHTWRLTDARVQGIRFQSDGDIHLVVADRSGRTIDAELPNPSCTTGAPPALRAKMEQARQAVFAAYGDGAGKGFHPIRGTTTLTGVGFFDFPHQSAGAGAAPNAVELHPVLSFTSTG